MRLPSWLVPRRPCTTTATTPPAWRTCAAGLAPRQRSLGVNYSSRALRPARVLYNEDGAIKGIATGDMGVGADGEQKAAFQAGYELHAKYTVFAEGCRGHLGKQLIEKFSLAAEAQTQHYGIGFKEIWDISSQRSTYPARWYIRWAGPWGTFPGQTLGGSYIYHLEDNQIAIGLIVDLGYSNPHLSPFDEFQRFKQHKFIKHYLEGGKAYRLRGTSSDQGRTDMPYRSWSCPAACSSATTPAF